MEVCQHCQKELSGNFCSHCGRAQQLRRIDGKYIISEIGSVLNFDKGFLYTVRELLVRPGQSVQTFIKKDRNKLVKPIIFIIVCSLIYTLAQQVFHFEDGYVTAEGFEESTTAKFFAWIQNNYGYSNIMMATFIAFWIKIFFRKHNNNFFEIVILLCYVMGIGMLMYTLFGVLETITNLRVLHLGAVVAFIYSTWAIAQFFDKRKVMNYVKALASYLIGMFSLLMLVVLLGFLIDALIK